MGNLGMPELILILVLALLLFGPKKLPEVGKQVGKALGEFRRASNDLKRTIEDEMDRATREEPHPAASAPAATVAAAPEAPAPHVAEPAPPAAEPKAGGPTTAS
jgi:TatA/E family protein of Tat protein translocase